MPKKYNVLGMPQPTLHGNPRYRNSQLEIARLPFALKNLLEGLLSTSKEVMMDVK